jgi:diacylglycerol kinase
VIRHHFGHNRGAESGIGGGSAIRREKAMRSWLGSLAIFVLVLAVLKFFFGWNISIIGSVVLTIILTLVFSLFNRR